MFIKNVLALHGSPNTIIFDKKPQFVNDFWKRFCKIININKRLLTVYYSQTDGVTERINLIIKAYFKTFINWD